MWAAKLERKREGWDFRGGGLQSELPAVVGGSASAGTVRRDAREMTSGRAISVDDWLPECREHLSGREKYLFQTVTVTWRDDELHSYEGQTTRGGD